jgi:membrane dipeptidase
VNRRGALQVCLWAGASLVASRVLGNSTASDATRELVESTVTVDMHSHIPPDATLADFAIKAGMEQAGLSAISASFPVDAIPWQAQGQWYGVFLDWVQDVKRLANEAGIREITSLADLEACHRDRVPGLLQSAEGAQFLEGRLERLGRAYDGGLRHLQLAHSVRDPFAPLGDLQTLEPRFDGLTPFGRSVIEECNRLGIVTDLAHSSRKTVRDALEVSSVPIIFSHTALLSPVGLGAVPTWSDTRLPMRLLRPDDAQAIAAAGGVIGVWHLFPTISAYAAAIIDLVNTVGEDHVGIGSDTGVAGAMYNANQRWPGQRAGFLYAIVGELRAQGCPPATIRKVIGQNYCRILRATEQGREC